MNFNNSIRHLLNDFNIILIIFAFTVTNKHLIADEANTENINKEVYRLEESIKPIDYTIHFTPYFLKNTFKGEESISVNISKNTKRITLHSKDLTIKQLSIHLRNRKLIPKITKDELRQQIILDMPETIPKGSLIIKISFEGDFNKDSFGFFSGKQDNSFFAGTTLQPIYARTMFPCFDEPSMKAYFNISVTIPDDLKAISNSDILNTKNNPEKKLKTVTFAKSPKIPTYAITLAIGNFSTVEGRINKNIPIRVHAISNIKKETLIEILEWIQKFIPVLEKTIGVDYPYSKLDYIYLPEYGGQALETAAAIQSSDYSIKSWSPKMPHASKFWEKNTIFHETAHQWFGNEVTMNWWNDLWLNESFATWIEHLLETFPETANIVTNDRAYFLNHNLEEDSKISTRPISKKDVNPENDGSAIFDNSIVYFKGANIIDMISNFIGKDVFLKGVQKYLLKYRKENTTSEMFWSEIDDISQKNISTIVKNWIESPGYPLITVDSKCENGITQITFSQERMFLEKPKTNNDTIWNVPLFIKTGKEDGSIEENIFLLTETMATKSFSGCRWIFPNSELKGFYRFKLTSQSLKLLKPQIQKLSPQEKIALLLFNYNTALGSYTKFDEYLELQNIMYNDDDIEVASAFLDQLSKLEKYFLKNDKDRKGWNLFIDKFANKWIEKIGYNKLDNEDSNITNTRQSLLTLLAKNNPDHEISKKARRLLIDLMENNTKETEMLKEILLPVSLVGSDSNSYKKVVKFYNEMPNDSKNKSLLLYAIMNSSQKEFIPETVDLCLSKNKSVDPYDRCIYLLLNNPKIGYDIWVWMSNNANIFERHFAGEKAEYFVSNLKYICDEDKYDLLPIILNGFNRTDAPFMFAKEKTISSIKTCLEVKKRFYHDLENWLNYLDTKAVGNQ